MIATDEHAGNPPRLLDSEFQRISQLIYQSSGIVLNEAKRTMVEYRLAKRLKTLGLDTFSAYCEVLFGSGSREQELIALLDAVTVNRTDFFRESTHFDYLVRTAAPELASRLGAGFSRPFEVWSAACSTGEEPYTLAMVLDDFGKKQASAFNFSILATDICTRVLAVATKAIYDETAAGLTPPHLFRTYFLRSKQKDRGVVRVSPEIRARVRFERANLVHGQLAACGSMDVVFCRNVIIYFDRATQQAVMSRVADRLRPGGYLFMGHSETLNFLELPLTAVAPTIYRRLG